MAANSTGFALSAGMAAIVVLLGYTLLHATGLVGLLPAPAPEEPAGCGVTADTAVAWCGNAMLEANARAQLPYEDQALVVWGDALFKGNCAQCHAVNDKVVGPALAGITKRRPLAWLIPWVQNSSKVVASGDAYAVKLFTEYQRQQMPSFDLSEQEITAIVRYIDTEQGTAYAPEVFVQN